MNSTNKVKRKKQNGWLFIGVKVFVLFLPMAAIVLPHQCNGMGFKESRGQKKEWKWFWRDLDFLSLLFTLHGHHELETLSKNQVGRALPSLPSLRLSLDRSVLTSIEDPRKSISRLPLNQSGMSSIPNPRSWFRISSK